MKKTFLYALKHSLPIMIGFFPLGVAYGILMESAGYNALWSGLCGVCVFAGSLQFLMVSFFTGGISLADIILLSLLLNSRHIFYGISFIERFRKYGFGARLFLIYSLVDETYSLHCSYQQEEGVNEKWVFIFTAALVLTYWVGFSVLGGLVGSLITFNTQGIDFSLTILFAVILIDQLRSSRDVFPACAAAVTSVACLLLFGSDGFILPSLVMSSVIIVMVGKIKGRFEAA